MSIGIVFLCPRVWIHIMKVKELIRLLKSHEPDAHVRFSVANDHPSADPEERWFCEDGVHDSFGDSGEVTLCLVVYSNMEDPEP